MLDEKALPQEYKDAMKKLLKDEYPLYIESLSKKVKLSCRVNTLKITKKNLLKLLNLEAKNIPWEENGFYINEDIKLTKSPYYYAGLYYMQEASAMAPAALCDVNVGDKILDLCAAPGGKSTHIACKLNGSGIIFSNDLSSSRAKALLKNIELFGIKNTIITCEEPEKLAKTYVEYFDKILVDAPCSGEGMFRKDNSILKAYLKRGPEYFAPIQADILSSAAKMLKKGGSIIYSTCTYSKIEDDDTIIKFLEKNKDFEIGDLTMYEGFSTSPYLEKAVRLLPHKLEGEGHFVCKLIKKGNIIINEVSNKKFKKRISLEKDFLEFLNLTNIKWDIDRFYKNNEYIYYLPQDFELSENIRYLRTGLLMGRITNNRFEPSQALAMSFKYEDWKEAINFSINDERVIRYLKGETIDIEENYKGYRLLCVEKYPLGFIKQDGTKLKNKYYKGWRIN